MSNIYQTTKRSLINHGVNEELASGVALIIAREHLTGIINRTPEEQAKVWEAWGIANHQQLTANS